MARIRFSLATLLMGVLLAGSAGSLYWRWGPWVLERHWEKFSIQTEEDKYLIFASYSPDSRRIVVGTEHAAAIYDVRTGAEFVRLKVPAAGKSLRHGRFTPDGRHVYIKQFVGSRLFDAATGDEDLGFGSNVLMLADVIWAGAEYSPDCSKMVAFDPDGDRVVLYSKPDFRQGREIFRYPQKINGPPIFAFSADSTLLSVAADGQNVRIFDSTQNKLVAEIPATGAISFLPGRDQIALDDGNGLEIWDLKRGNRVKQLTHNRIFSASLIFSPDGSRLLDGCTEESQVSIVDAADGSRLATLGQVESLSYLLPLFRSGKQSWRPDGQQLMTGDVNCLVFYRRTRPEWWWGVFCLPELWMTAILTLGLSWRMLRRLRKPKPIVAGGQG